MTDIPASVTPTVIPDGAGVVAAPHRGNYAAIASAINQIITILSGGDSGQVLLSGGPESVSWGDGLPSGAMIDYGAAAAPMGWLLCDGSSVLQTDYPSLFTAIGTTYGSADGTHFNVPDLRGRVAVGYAASGGHTDVSTLGLDEGSAAANRRPKHPHTFSLETDPSTANWGAGGGAGAPTNDIHEGAVSVTGTIGVAGTASDTPAYIVVNKIIKI